MEALQSQDTNNPPLKTARPFVLSLRYEVVRCLAKGGTSVIYLAKDNFFDDAFVVLKCIHSELSASASTHNIARAEYSIARQVSHPSLVRIYDLRQHKGMEYMVMEYLPGDSLKNVLARNSFTYNRALQVIERLIDVLSCLHQKGIVHSDVKPANIIIGDDNAVKLIDLANCRQDSKAKKPAIKVKSEHFYGYSLDYSSPQVINDLPATISDDVFSVACVLYEMLEGVSPIPSNKKSVDMPISSVKRPKGINSFQWRVLKRAMSMDTFERYSSLSEFYQAFTKAKVLPLYALLSLVFVISFCALAFAIWNERQQHQREYSLYSSAYQQQQQVQESLQDIRSKGALVRYQHLGSLDSLPASSRQTALALLHNEVVNPVLAAINESLLASTGSPDFNYIEQQLDELAGYYPSSLILLETKKQILKERKQLIDALTVRLTNMAESGVYGVDQAVEFNQSFNELAAVDSGIAKYVVKTVDVSIYASLVEEAFSGQDWIALGNYYQFAMTVKGKSPVFIAVWSAYPSELAQHLPSFNYYLQSDSVEHFPVTAAEYLIGKELREMKGPIQRVFYNKDIQRYADKLLSIKTLYRVPDSFDLYKEIKQVLLKKIAEKIQFHKSKRQVKSARRLSELEEALTR